MKSVYLTAAALTAAALIVCLAGNFAFAQQTGDQVVTVTARAELRNKNVSTGKVPRGAILSVERVDGDRFWVRWSDRDGTVKGWIARQDVVPLSRALELFSAELRKTPSALNYRLRGAIWSARLRSDEAISDLNEALRLDPRDAVACRERGRAWMVKGQNDKALADFDEAIRLDPKDAVSYRWRAVLWMIGSALEKAYADVDTAARLDPQNPDVFVGRGNMGVVRGELEQAIADCSRAIELDPEAADAYTSRGTVWMMQGKLDQAVADFAEAIRRNPQDSEAYQKRGGALFGAGKYQKAVQDFNVAIRIDPKEAGAYENRANALCEMGEFDKALADYNEAIRMEPNETGFWTNRGHIWRLKADYDKLLSDSTEAIRLDPTNANAHVARGGAWLDKGEYDRAISDFSKAIEFDPSRTSAYLHRGSAWKEKGQTDKAIADYTKAISLCNAEIEQHGKGAVIYEQRARAWQSMGDCETAIWATAKFDQAVSDYQAALRLDPKDANTHCGCGDAWKGKGDFAKALEAYKRAVELSPKLPTVWNSRAWLAATCPDAKYRNGKQAVDDATRSCELTDWKDSHSLDVLAAAYAEAGDFANAAKWQTKAIERIAPAAWAKLARRLDLYQHQQPYREALRK